MYMFRSKRAALTRRLLRQAKHAGDEQARHALLKRLKEPQLELLTYAVELAGAGASECVLAPRAPPPVNSGASDVPPPHVLACRVWRWPDIASAEELRRLPACHAAHDPVYVCCNPYHLSRLVSLPVGMYLQTIAVKLTFLR